MVCADLVGWWKLDDGAGTVVKLQRQRDQR
jgi:hypothetical protein